MRYPNTSTTRSRRTLLGVIAAIALVTAACGSDSDSSGESADTTTPTSDTAGSTETTAAPAPGGTDATTDPTATIDPAEVAQRIVSLSPTHTEIIFAIGAGEQLVAVDDYSNFPEEALDLPHELSGFEPNVEAILAYQPDLVIAPDDTGDLVSGLRKAQVPTLLLPAAADPPRSASVRLHGRR